MAFQTEEPAGKTGTPRAAVLSALKWVENTHRGADGARTGLFTRAINGVAALFGVAGLAICVIWPIYALSVGFWWPDVLFVWTWFIIATCFLLTFDLWYAKAYSRVIVIKGLLTGGRITGPTDPKSVLFQFRKELGFASNAPQAPVSARKGSGRGQGPSQPVQAPQAPPSDVSPDASERAAAEALMGTEGEEQN